MRKDFKQVSISVEDSREYEAMIDSWAAKHDGIKLSMAKMINLAMLAYRESNGL